jgi:hypothetical protein
MSELKLCDLQKVRAQIRDLRAKSKSNPELDSRLDVLEGAVQYASQAKWGKTRDDGRPGLLRLALEELFRFDSTRLEEALAKELEAQLAATEKQLA